MAQIITTANIYETRYFIFPEIVGTLDEIPEEVKDIYLVDNEKYQLDNKIIKNGLKEAVGDEKNPYWIARGIYQYLIDNMNYEMVGGWNTAPTVLERGNGSCSEYSFVYIAMCRAAGLPARYVGSVVVRGDDASFDDVFHRWVEVYLPNYGWIPVDPSGGDQSSPRNQANYFGHLANRFLITTENAGGSEYMGWTYNSNAFYTSEPKSYVVSDHYSDWKPPK
jgi:transglutaminase-like putative cysteine protease